MNQENDTISKQDISGLLKEFNNTLNVIGVERLTEILIYSRKNNIHLTEKQLVSANDIIKVVCEEFNITIDDLYSAKRKNNMITPVIR
jgi:chromosomal replication initiation ATPase DnaA